MKLTQKSIMGN